MSEDGFDQGFKGVSIFPRTEDDITGGQSVEWWREHRRGFEMAREVERAATPAIYRAYVRLSYSLDALTRTHDETEAA